MKEKDKGEKRSTFERQTTEKGFPKLEKKCELLQVIDGLKLKKGKEEKSCPDVDEIVEAINLKAINVDKLVSQDFKEPDLSKAPSFNEKPYYSTEREFAEISFKTNYLSEKKNPRSNPFFSGRFDSPGNLMHAKSLNIKRRESENSCKNADFDTDRGAKSLIFERNKNISEENKAKSKSAVPAPTFLSRKVKKGESKLRGEVKVNVVSNTNEDLKQQKQKENLWEANKQIREDQKVLQIIKTRKFDQHFFDKLKTEQIGKLMNSK
jgi:hypothetical protein